MSFLKSSLLEIPCIQGKIDLRGNMIIVGK